MAMIIMNCPCGVRLEGDGDDGLFVALRDHTHRDHSDLTIADAQMHALVCARSRMAPWDGRSISVSGDVEIRRLTPDLADDFLAFFDGEAFMDNRVGARHPATHPG